MWRASQNPRGPATQKQPVYENDRHEKGAKGCRAILITPPEETEHGTRPGGRDPGGVPGGVGAKNRGGHVRVYRGGSIPYSH